MATPANTILLFDVDGTLTVPRKHVTPDMLAKIAELRAKGYTVAIVGGSDLSKQKEQLGANVLELFDYVFSENGLHSFRHGEEFHRQSLTQYFGDEKLKRIVNKTLSYLAELDIPQKRGTFFELRNGMINISPIGRNCNQSERDAFEVFDASSGVRKKMIEALRESFGNELGLEFSIGGQISFDVFPKGWDKTYCLQFLPVDRYSTIHFFGDKTSLGGNDYEIFEHPRTIGHRVETYTDTLEYLTKNF